MKHRIREKGFTALEVVIVVVVVAALAFGSWWVWQKNSEELKDTTNQTSINSNKEEGSTGKEIFDCKGIFSVSYPDSLSATLTNSGQCLLSNVDIEDMPATGPLPSSQVGLFFTTQATQIKSSQEYLDDYVQRSQEDYPLELKSHETIKLDNGDFTTLATLYGGHPTEHDFYFFIYIKEGKSITTSYPINSDHKETVLNVLKSIE